MRAGPYAAARPPGARGVPAGMNGAWASWCRNAAVECIGPAPACHGLTAKLVAEPAPPYEFSPAVGGRAGDGKGSQCATARAGKARRPRRIAPPAGQFAHAQGGGERTDLDETLRLCRESEYGGAPYYRVSTAQARRGSSAGGFRPEGRGSGLGCACLCSFHTSLLEPSGWEIATP